MTALIGREDEFRAIEDCVQRWINEGDAACIFVNGVPGTGKTATVTEVVKKLQSQYNQTPKGREKVVKCKVNSS